MKKIQKTFLKKLPKGILKPKEARRQIDTKPTFNACNQDLKNTSYHFLKISKVGKNNEESINNRYKMKKHFLKYSYIVIHFELFRRNIKKT